MSSGAKRVIRFVEKNENSLAIQIRRVFLWAFFSWLLVCVADWIVLETTDVSLHDYPAFVGPVFFVELVFGGVWLSLVGSVVANYFDARENRRASQVLTPRLLELRLLFGNGRISRAAFESVATDLGELADGTHETARRKRFARTMALVATWGAPVWIMGAVAAFGFAAYLHVPAQRAMSDTPYWIVGVLSTFIAGLGIFLAPWYWWRQLRIARRDWRATVVKLTETFESLFQAAAALPVARLDVRALVKK